MITRHDYMTGEATHREYYAQFVTPAILSHVTRTIGLDRLLGSTDDHLNDVPLADWDGMAMAYTVRTMIPRSAFEARGDTLSLAGLVCVLKEAGLQVRDACDNTRRQGDTHATTD